MDPITKLRTVVGEKPFADINLTLCTQPGQVYPDVDARVRYMHSFQMTQNYIALPETSYLYDYCGQFGKPPPL